jgi:cytochrome oxidase assembly protein ShyY1
MRQPKSKNLGSRIAAALAVLLLASIFFSLGIWQLDRAAALKASWSLQLRWIKILFHLNQ